MKFVSLSDVKWQKHELIKARFLYCDLQRTIKSAIKHIKMSFTKHFILFNQFDNCFKQEFNESKSLNRATF